MKLLLITAAAALTLSVAHAVPMQDTAINQCIAGELGGRAAAYPAKFCSCWVTAWMRAWDDSDFNQWQAGHPATLHMTQTSGPAAEECGGFPTP